MGIKTLVFRLITWRGRHEVHGLPVWAPLSSKEQKVVIVHRLGESLTLLSAYSPCRYARVQRSLSGFLIFGTDEVRGSYQPEPRLCRLGESFVLAPNARLRAAVTA